MPAPIMTVRVVVTGRVQGVWYRGWTVGEAYRRGLDGWVRNRNDGTVEALFSGPADAVNEMVGACRQGPPASRVENVSCVPAAAPDHPGFAQVPTV